MVDILASHRVTGLETFGPEGGLRSFLGLPLPYHGVIIAFHICSAILQQGETTMI